VPRELGVDRLVGAVGLALEKVGNAAPPPAGERTLVDDVDAGPNGVLRLAHRAIPVEVRLELDLNDVLAVGPKPSEVGGLVLAALTKDQLRLLVLDLGFAELAERGLHGQRRQVLAAEVTRDVGRGERELTVAELHVKRVSLESVPTS
jgi:hypothetical protein